MTGGNCCIPGCPTSRRPAFKGIALFTITQRKGQFYVNWRDDIITVLRKYREFDALFRKQLASGNVFICENHYAPSEIELLGMYINFFCLDYY